MCIYPSPTARPLRPLHGRAARVLAALAMTLPALLAGTMTPQLPSTHAGPALSHLHGVARGGKCQIFPASNVWNTPIDALPVARNSDRLIAAIGLNNGLHPDFGADPSYGIPFNVVPGDQLKQPVDFYYADESDPGPYPIPDDPLIEEGGDAHMLMVDMDNCYLYELFDAHQSPDGWHAGSGAIWNLRSNDLRPDTWTSADAAGLPIFAGLVRYDEVAVGVIAHALRFTAPHTRNKHIYPARHDAGSDNSSLPPMGLRVRLKADFDISHFSPEAQVILQALKTYGMLLADNGGPWYMTGAPDPRWNDEAINELKQVKGYNLEVVDTRGLVNGG